MKETAHLKFVGILLRNERLRQDLTQQDVSERSCISRTQLTNIENGRNGSIPALMSISLALGYRIYVGLAPIGGVPRSPGKADYLKPHKKKLRSASDKIAKVSVALDKIIREIG